METTHTMTRPIANLPTAQTLMSVVSWPAWPAWGVSGCLVSSMFQNLLQVWGILRHQRALLQLREEVRQPEADQADGDGEIQEAEAEALRAEAGRDQPVEIDEAHRQNEQRDRSQQFEIAFQIAREQEREGQREMADHQQQSDELPAVIEAGQIPRDLFGQVARPDDEELGERKVRPHHDQGEQELAEIVQMALRQHFRHRLSVCL